ncbi:unnamed protein product [Alopecurus aequalis]
MDDEPAPETRYIPHELISRILLRLPVKSLMRFTCVCTTWHNTITGDESFQRMHHRLQEPCVLIAPLIKAYDGDPFSSTTNKKVTTPGLYRWEESQRAATLVQATDSFPAEEAWHKFAHCNGLVLMPMNGTVRVLNPATRRVLTLPERPQSVPRNRRARLFNFDKGARLYRGAFGLRYDPRSNTYKVARLFYRQVDVDDVYVPVMEVFTIGIDEHWRETAAPPPYPVVAGQTATFFKASLLWTIDESLLKNDSGVRGFLRFNLEDESFSVTPAPPGCPKLQNWASNLAEVDGDLYLAHEGSEGSGQPHQIWACGDVDGDEPPRWVQRRAIVVPHGIRLIAAFDDGIVFQGSHCLSCFDSGMTRGYRHVASMDDLTYHHLDTNTSVEYIKETVHGYDAIPYVPSLVPI